MGVFKDLTGMRFGRLVVIGRDKSKKKVHWLCQCDCGGRSSVDSYSLTHGITVSCGCYAREMSSKANIKNLQGQRFERLTVTKRYVANELDGVYWYCDCDCGEKDIISSSKNLLSGHKKSCGCLHKENNTRDKPERIVDLTGKRFGKLTVIGIDKKVNGEYKWLCICDCNPKRVISILGGNLRSGHTQSCGCLNSKGEELISNILHSYNVNFKSQYTFDDLLTEFGNRMRFDFGILNRHGDLLYLIEFDGMHHFKCRESGWNNSENLKQVKKDDLKKDTYCKENNILLIRIPYFDYNKIDIEMLIPEIYKKELLEVN